MFFAVINKIATIYQRQKKDAELILFLTDYVENNPSQDDLISATYTFDTYSKKSKNKEDIQKLFSIDVTEKKMVLGVVSRLANQKGIDLIANSIPWIVKNNMQLVVLGSGDKEIEKSLQQYRDMYPNNVGIYLGFSNELAHKVYAGCSFILKTGRFQDLKRAFENVCKSKTNHDSKRSCQHIVENCFSANSSDFLNVFHRNNAGNNRTKNNGDYDKF